MVTKYFDFLNKEITFIDNIDEIKSYINLYRSILKTNPTQVGLGARTILETLIKKIAHKNDIDSTLKLVILINELKSHSIISKETRDHMHNLRLIGNDAAHNPPISINDAHKSLLLLDKILRALISATGEHEHREIKDDMFIITYETYERKIIYIQTADNKDGLYNAYDGLEKIGDASVPDEIEADLTPNSDYIRKFAKRRINQYMKTAGVPYNLQWAQLAVRDDRRFFRDHDVHNVLKRSGFKPEPLGYSENGKPNEWFRIEFDLAKKAVKAVKEGRSYLNTKNEVVSDNQITLRPEQKEAIAQTSRVFKKNNKMLWNAKMRFGKTITALQLIKEKKFEKVLIITHRPVVSQGWFEDFNKIFRNTDYLFGSKFKGENFDYLTKNKHPFIYFASIQDLRGSEWAGGRYTKKNNDLINVDWELLIIDEAHEGNETILANSMKSKLINENTKILELSGTPFNLLDKYDEENVFTWDYTMEQQAKDSWEIENENLPNPYEGLPRVSMYTFEVNNKEEFLDENRAFNFKEFFKVDPQTLKFIYEKNVINFLDNITNPDSKNNYPYSTEKFRNNLKHTLWLLPGVAEANALEALLKKHNIFRQYNIVNVVKKNDDTYANSDDLDMVRNAIGPDPSLTKTITLTVRKLTTGVTVPEWTGVVFLSNTNSPTTYLQAAFRAQSPFNHESVGVKKNCYIFDFAPDRALKIMSESIGVTSKRGKINTTEQKDKLSNMLNFFPILGQTNNGMKEYNVEKMLTKLKKVYAEKAVNSGFEDSSIYNDNLLTINEDDLVKFNELKSIVGASSSAKLKKISINKNNLDKEELEKATKLEKKPKKERSDEENELINELKRLNDQRRKLILILQEISTKIPLMIYGIDANIDEDITLNKFIESVDEKSWEEFMPVGVSKDKFKEFTRFYDAEVFIEAGRIIRKRVKSYDKLDYIERTSKLAELFSGFKNPDKETVLTPWKVVDMHLSHTLGGLSGYNDLSPYTTLDIDRTLKWIETNITKDLYNENTTFLDINSKTGLYPLFVATSLYYKIMIDHSQNNNGRFNADDIWKQVLKNNIYVIAQTPMARRITLRTLMGYNNYQCNVIYIDNFLNDIKTSKGNEIANSIERKFNSVKFDVVIGNPPYQETVAAKETNNGQKRVTNIFQHFQIAADRIAQKHVSLIYPGGRWIHQNGKGLSSFGYNQINDPTLSKLIYFPDANEVFHGVSIADGISIVQKDVRKATNGFDYNYIKNGKIDSLKLENPGKKLLILNPKDKVIVDKTDAYVSSHNLNYIGHSKVINQKLFRIESSFVEENPSKISAYVDEEYDKDKFIKLFANDKAGKMGRTKWFLVERDQITHNAHLVNEWQVVVSSANAGGQKRDNKISIIDNNSAFGRSRLALKSFKTKKEAENFMAYAQTSIIRFLFLMTGESLSSLGMKVPDLEDYTGNSPIDFDKDIDKQLQKIFDLSSEHMDHIIQTLNNIR